ncbi:MAG: ATP-binding cassette domain-containing protein [Methanomicrobiales archaeon]|nr:ATP-binding cassette domain-containing protein [Methanomicrobiales archaeon]
MKILLEEIEVIRGSFSLRGSGNVFEGVHLIWGPVGCGKTTLALLLAGLLVPGKGKLRKEGISKIGFLTQFPEYQITSRTIGEEVESWGADPARVLKDSDLIGREEEDPLRLSRGELKRLLLITLLMNNPDLLLLDEPFGGLDCRERRRLIQKLTERSSAITILFSHDHSIMPRIDYLWEIQQGMLLYRGGMPEAISHWSCPPPYLRSIGQESLSVHFSYNDGEEG